MPTGEEKTAGHGTRHAAESEIQRSMVVRMSAETYLFLVVAGVAGVLGSEGGAPGSLRASLCSEPPLSRKLCRSSNSRGDSVVQTSYPRAPGPGAMS
jgi:hypothetical protein